MDEFISIVDLDRQAEENQPKKKQRNKKKEEKKAGEIISDLLSEEEIKEREKENEELKEIEALLNRPLDSQGNERPDSYQSILNDYQEHFDDICTEQICTFLINARQFLKDHIRFAKDAGSKTTATNLQAISQMVEQYVKQSAGKQYWKVKI